MPRFLAMLVLCLAVCAQTRLLRHPSYHNGQIVFDFQGDLWLARDDGSAVTRLTTHQARDQYPRFSPDGKWIAFSSNRYGNYDVFVMPGAGGEARQLTWHAASDQVAGWSRDGQRVLFTSMRGDGAFPSVLNLYEVAVAGGLEQIVPTDWGSGGSWSADGTKIAFTRHSATWSRQHYRGANNGDVWIFDAKTKEYRDLRDPLYKGNMLWPMYGPKSEIWFVADRLADERNVKPGSPEVMKSLNQIWRVAERGGKWEQVTKHETGNLFFPSMSADGKVIVYEYDHAIWKLDTASGKTQMVPIRISADARDNPVEWKSIASNADSYSLSPSGRRAAISAHGEIFTVATDRGEAQRVTRSFRRDTSPRWSPDGKWIAFTSDESGREEVWVADEMGKTRKKITDADTEKRTLGWAPDSRSLLVSSTDNKLWRIEVDSGQATEIAASETSPPTNPALSPDGQWISYSALDRDMRPRVYVKPAAGGEARRIGSDDLFSASSAAWTPDGKKLVLTAGVVQMGMASLGRSSNSQLYTVNLQKEEKDPLDKGIDSESEAAAAAPAGPPAGRMGGGAPAPAKVEVKIDWDGLEKRIRPLTRLADTVSAFAISPDSTRVAFVTVGAQEARSGPSLWTIQMDGERMTRVAQAQAPAADEGERGPRGQGFGFGGGMSSPQWARDGRSLYFLERDGIYSVSAPPAPAEGASGGPPTAAGGPSASASAAASTPPRRRVNFSLRVEVDQAAERAQVFDEGWRIMKHRFYDPKMHGVNWTQAKDRYASLLPHVGDNEELRALMMEMIGELNASHTGVSGGGDADRSIPQTRHPGFEIAPDASGFYKVIHVYAKGPADKDHIRLKPGDFVLALNGQDFKSGDNYWKLYTLTTARRFEFLVNAKPSKDGARVIGIEPASASAAAQLQYDKWVNDRKTMVEKASNGEIGYLHIQAMNAPSFRKFELDLADSRFKKALIIDQRFNGGGGIDQELLQVLAQRMYQKTRRRDGIMEERPQRAFFGPMVVMANERSGSNAEMFPDGFRALGLGKVIGVPTAGAVIGTGAFSLLDGSSIRTPGVGVYTGRGENMENFGVPPDVYIDNLPADFAAGRDAQILKAVEVLKAEIAAQAKK